jgi:hypothetical protein
MSLKRVRAYPMILLGAGTAAALEAAPMEGKEVDVDSLGHWFR